MTEIFYAILHLDTTLAAIISNVGSWVYAILFLIILAETGFVVTPFLPGDSLLFAVGTFAALGSLNPWLLILLLSLAAIAGDTINYLLGRKLGESVLRKGSLFGIPIKREYLEKTQKFYRDNGPQAIVFARFLPIIRTFAPFVAGIAKMEYATFAYYNIVSGIGWVTMFVLGGYYFGNIPLVKDNFTIAILIVIFVSFLPGIYGFVKSRTSGGDKASGSAKK